jgi:hypothetical protein
MKLTSIIPLSHANTRTTGFQGTRIRMADPPGAKSGSLLALLYCRNVRASFCKYTLSIVELYAQSTRTGKRIHSKPGWRKPRKYEPGEIRAKSTSALSTTM